MYNKDDDNYKQVIKVVRRDYDKMCKLFNTFGITYCVCFYEHNFIVTIESGNGITFIFDAKGKYLRIE